MDVYTYILSGYLIPSLSLIVSVSSHKHTEGFFSVFSEQLMRTISASPADGSWWELMGALHRRCHRLLSAARPPNVNIDFTVWRSGKCVWDGYVHSGGPRRTVQAGRKIPRSTRTDCVHSSFTLLKHEEMKWMRALPAKGDWSWRTSDVWLRIMRPEAAKAFWLHAEFLEVMTPGDGSLLRGRLGGRRLISAALNWMTKSKERKKERNQSGI